MEVILALIFFHRVLIQMARKRTLILLIVVNVVISVVHLLKSFVPLITPTMCWIRKVLARVVVHVLLENSNQAERVLRVQLLDISVLEAKELQTKSFRVQ